MNGVDYILLNTKRYFFHRKEYPFRGKYMEYIFLSSLEGGKMFGSKDKQEGALK